MDFQNRDCNGNWVTPSTEIVVRMPIFSSLALTSLTTNLASRQLSRFSENQACSRPFSTHISTTCTFRDVSLMRYGVICVMSPLAGLVVARNVFSPWFGRCAPENTKTVNAAMSVHLWHKTWQPPIYFLFTDMQYLHSIWALLIYGLGNLIDDNKDTGYASRRNSPSVSMWPRVTGPMDIKRTSHDDVMEWKHFPRYWPFLWGIYRPALMFSLISAWINGRVNNREAGDLRHHRGHYDVTVMLWSRK